MIPDIKEKEWEDLITGEIRPIIYSFSLQMKLNTLQTSYNKGDLDIKSAIKDLHTMCCKYERVYMYDLKKIFEK